MKKSVILLTIFGLMFSRATFADDPCIEEAEVFFTDEDDSYFNKGKFVGQETDEYMRARQRVRNRNWAIAIGTTAVGIATLVLVGNNHH